MENEVKEPAPKYNYISPEAYLAAERASESRSEYHWLYPYLARNL